MVLISYKNIKLGGSSAPAYVLVKIEHLVNTTVNKPKGRMQ